MTIPIPDEYTITSFTINDVTLGVNIHVGPEHVGHRTTWMLNPPGVAPYVACSCGTVFDVELKSDSRLPD